nr:hypothetical protein Iba_chr15fCG5140 [Ipomoea batatas]
MTSTQQEHGVDDVMFSEEREMESKERGGWQGSALSARMNVFPGCLFHFHEARWNYEGGVDDEDIKVCASVEGGEGDDGGKE